VELSEDCTNPDEGYVRSQTIQFGDCPGSHLTIRRCIFSGTIGLAVTSANSVTISGSSFAGGSLINLNNVNQLTMETTTFQGYQWKPVLTSRQETLGDQQLWFYALLFEEIEHYDCAITSGFRYNYCDLITLQRVSAAQGFFNVKEISESIPPVFSRLTTNDFTTQQNGMLSIIDCTFDGLCDRGRCHRQEQQRDRVLRFLWLVEFRC
jgi:hypothetical protein